MKKIIFITLFFLGTTSFAQGNLQFNQVITQNYSISGQGANTLYNSNTSLTVPTGKVWKIESIIYYGNSQSDTYAPNCILMINGSKVLFEKGTSYRNDSGITLNQQPIWLKAGDQIGFSMRNTCANCSQSVDGLISIIEFNIIP